MCNHGNRLFRVRRIVRKGLHLRLAVEHNRRAAPAFDARHLGVARTAQDNYQASCAALLVRDPVDLLHKRAGRVENFAFFVRERVVNRARHAMRPDEHLRPIRNLRERVRSTHAALFQPRDLVHIMDDLAIGPDFAVFSRLLLGQFDRAAHAEAETGGFGYRYRAHTLSFSA